MWLHKKDSDPSDVREEQAQLLPIIPTSVTSPLPLVLSGSHGNNGNSNSRMNNKRTMRRDSPRPSTSSSPSSSPPLPSSSSDLRYTSLLGNGSDTGSVQGDGEPYARRRKSPGASSWCPTLSFSRIPAEICASVHSLIEMCQSMNKDTRSMILAVVLLIIHITAYLSEAELLQSLQVDSTSTYFPKPFFINWCASFTHFLLLLIWAAWAYHFRGTPIIDKRRLKKVASWSMVLSFLLVVSNYLWIVSVSETSVTANTVITNIEPIIIFVLGYFVVRERVSILKVVSVIICLSGVAVAVFFAGYSDSDGDGVVKQTLRGVVFSVLSTVTYALFQILYQKLVEGEVPPTAHHIRIPSTPLVHAATTARSNATTDSDSTLASSEFDKSESHLFVPLISSGDEHNNKHKEMDEGHKEDAGQKTVNSNDHENTDRKIKVKQDEKEDKKEKKEDEEDAEEEEEDSENKADGKQANEDGDQGTTRFENARLLNSSFWSSPLVLEVMESFFFVGVSGFTVLFLCWPAIPILDATGTETFEWPDGSVFTDIVYVALLDVTCHTTLMLCICVSSALFVSVGALLTIPAAVVADKIARNYVLPVWGILGILTIIVGFVMFNYAEYRLEQEEMRRNRRFTTEMSVLEPVSSQQN